MEINSPETIRPDAARLKFVITTGKENDMTKLGEWKIEIFSSLEEHIDVVRGRLATALNDPGIVAAGHLFKKGGSWQLIFGAQTLEKEGICSAGLGFSIKDAMTYREIIEAAINNHLETKTK